MKKICLVFICIANLGLAQETPETFLVSSEAGWFSVTANHVGELVEFCWKRVPNAQEILWYSGIEETIDLLLGDYTKSLVHNPAAKSVLRDTMKMPSAIIKAQQGVRVGGTEYYFDRSHAYSQSTKMVFKIGGMLTLITIFKMPPGKAAVLANYPADIIARYFVKAGQYRQKSNSTASFEEYLLTGSEPIWLLETVVEIAPKIVVTHYVGKYLVENTQLCLKVRGSMIHLLNKFQTHKINPSDTLYRNMHNQPWVSRPITFLFMMTTMFAEKTV